MRPIYSRAEFSKKNERQEITFLTSVLGQATITLFGKPSCLSLWRILAKIGSLKIETMANAVEFKGLVQSGARSIAGCSKCKRCLSKASLT
jgi:hypothetical protein